jgi:CzcA family heavy metal efflux pump
MLSRLVRFSVDNPLLVVAVSALLLVLAAYQVPRMAVDVFPELNAPTVVIMTESPGYAAEEVEQYVSFPVESSVNGIPGVRRVRSASAIGLSIVWVEFDWGVDIYRARYLVSERLGVAEANLPPGVHTEIAPVTSITGEILLLSLTSPDGSVDELGLRAYGEFDLRNRLLAVPGVSQVVTIGGELPEYQVHVDQDRLRLYDLTVQDVVEAARQAHSTAAAGYLPNVEGLEIPLRQSARVRSVGDIASTIVLYRDGVPITIGQVADVSIGGALKRGTASQGGRSAVVLSVQKAPGTNTLALTDAIDAALDSAEAAMPEGIRLDRHVFRQAEFIGLSLRNVVSVARDAAIIVAIVLLLFLLNVRATIITLTAIPMSVAIALLVLWGRGETINVMTLGGLAVAIGIVVDDAIIFVENMHRRLRESASAGEGGDSKADVLYRACRELVPSVVFATGIIVLVFVPLLFLGGLEGRFFRPLGVTYILAISASLLVAVTLTPALARPLLAAGSSRGPGRKGFVVRGLEAAYRPLLGWVVRRRVATVIVALACTAASLGLASTFGTSFLPEFNEGTFTVFVMAPPGTSLEESDRMARAIERRLTDVEGVRKVVRRTGRAERDEHAEPVSTSEIEIIVAEGHRKEAVRRSIDDILEELPGITTTIGQPIEHRISHILSGTPAAIAINVFGDDLRRLRVVAREIEAALEKVPGARDVAANREAMITSLPIRYRHEELARWGLTPATAAEQVKDAIFGEVVSVVNDGVNLYDIVVRLAPDRRETVEQVRDLVLRGSDGKLARLREVAEIGRERTPYTISRENARRKAVVSCNVAEGYNLGHLVERVREVVDPIVARHGYSASFGGQFEAQRSASRTILLMGAGVTLIVLLLLNLSFGSTRAALLVMINLPLALIGGILAIFLTESAHPLGNALALVGLAGPYRPPVVSIASLVGFVTLFGIAVRNGILLVNHYAHLRRDEGLSLEEAVLRGSEERLVPILMTALTAVLGLVPLALAAGEPGSELLAPLAIVILGGLASSTLLNLLVVPAGYLLVFRNSSTSSRARTASSSSAP